MHDREADIDHGLVQRLVAAQFPRLAGLPVREVRSAGTVNAIYRAGRRVRRRDRDLVPGLRVSTDLPSA